MSLPSLTNSMVGTRLLDLISTTATSNEVITLGYSNDYGTQIRFYDNNLPSSGGIIKYNSSNYAISFIRDYNNTVNVGINTSRPNAALHIVGDVNITGTFNTSNLIVTGSSTYNATSIGVVNTLSIYQPSGTDIYGTVYKNITTNDTTANNRILFTTSLQSGKYLFSFNIPYSNLTPSFLLNTTYVNLGLYNSPFTLSSQPLQSFSIPVYKNTNQLNVTPEFYLPVSSTTSYDIAISGQGEKLQFGGSNANCTANIITISGLSNLSSTTYTSSLPQISPLRQTYIIGINTPSVFTTVLWPFSSLGSGPNPTGTYNGILYAFNSWNQASGGTDWFGRWFYDFDYTTSLTFDGYTAGAPPNTPTTGPYKGNYSGIRSASSFIICGYRFESPLSSLNRLPNKIYVMGSLDDLNWTTVDSYTATYADYTTPLTSGYYGLDRRFNNTTLYKYYRVVFNNILSGSDFQVLEFRWYFGIYSYTTSQLTLSANGYYPTSHGNNIKIYKNGSNLNYISNDYTYTYSYNNSNNTVYSINFNSPLTSNDKVDVSIWPSINEPIYSQNGYMYQNIKINNNNLYVDESTQYVGIGTTTPEQQLTVNGQSYFNSNVGIGTINPSALLTVNDTWNDGSTTMAIQQSVINQEFPPVGISNFYFTPDYNDTIPSTEIGAQFSNLEYPPYAMTNYTTNLNAVYGAGYYTASASSEQSSTYSVWRAFDKTNAGTGATNSWSCLTTRYNTTLPYAYNGTVSTYDINGVNYPGEWLQIQLPIPIKVEKYSINVRPDSLTTNPSQWNVLDSSDGINWNFLDRRNGITWTTGATTQFGITNPSRYSSYYRLITSNLQGNGGYVSIGEWRLFTNTVIGQNYYPKYKATIPYYTSVNPYGLGQYQIWSDSILNSSYSNQAVPSGLFNKTVGSSSNTFWSAYGDFNDLVNGSVAPNIYIRLPDQLLLSSYSLTATGNPEQTPSKWNLYCSNTNQTMAWQSLNSQNGITTWTAFETKNYTVTTSSAYNFYKLELLRNSSPTLSKMSLGELRFYGNKQIPELRMVVSTNGFLNIGTSNTSLTTINGDFNVSGILGSSILNNGPNVLFDGSTTNRNTFLQWMQYVTSTDYRYALQPRIIQSCWWNTNTKTITNYSDYTYSTIIYDTNYTSYGYNGGVLLPDSRVIFIPFQNTSNIGIFDSSTNSFSYLQKNDGSNVYSGGVLVPDGRVIFTPYSSSTVGIFNSSTNTFSTLSGYDIGPSSSMGGVLLPNGNVFFVPHNSTRIQIFNPLTNIFTSILGAPGNNAYRGGVLLPDGRVICIPYDSTRIGIYDSTTNLFSTTITGAPGSAAYSGGVLLPDGRVIFIPYNYSINNYFKYSIFNTLTNTYNLTYIISNNGAGANQYYTGGVLLPDGCVLIIPYNTTGIILDITTNKELKFDYNNLKSSGGVLLPDGRVVLVPYSTSVIGILSPVNPPRPPPLELCYHPCFNHV